MSGGRDVEWRLTPEDGDNTYSWTQVKVGVLMDIRAELRKLNALLGCHRFVAVPTTLKEIRAAVRRLPVPRKKRRSRRRRRS